MDSRKVTAILMAAGSSARMGAGVDKLLLPYRGKTLLSRAIELLTEIPFRQVILVTTPARLARVTVPSSVRVALNHNPRLGQSESLRLGLGLAGGEGYLFCAADQPLLSRAALEEILSHGNETGIVYPVVAGKPCSPALFSSRFRGELLAQQGDAGGRAVREAHPERCVPLEATDPMIYQDIDTPQDYQRLLSGRR